KGRVIIPARLRKLLRRNDYERIANCGAPAGTRVKIRAATEPAIYPLPALGAFARTDTQCTIRRTWPAQFVVHAEQGKTMNIIEKSRETVEQLLARRNLPKTHEEKCQYALDQSTCIYMRKIPTVSTNASSFIQRMPSGRRPPAT